jgi:cell division protease FtsH
MTDAPKPKPRNPALLVVLALVAAAGLFVAVWQFLSPSERKMPVAYSDFISDVHAGKVEEILIHDREIRFRVRSDANPQGRSVVKETVGPIPDQAMVDSLKPTDPSAPRPKIVFEK